MRIELCSECGIALGEARPDLIGDTGPICLDCFAGHFNSGVAALRANPEASAEYDREAGEWDATLADGLDDEDGGIAGIDVPHETLFRVADIVAERDRLKHENDGLMSEVLALTGMWEATKSERDEMEAMAVGLTRSLQFERYGKYIGPERAREMVREAVARNLKEAKREAIRAAEKAAREKGGGE